MTARNAIGIMGLVATAACGTVTNVDAQSQPTRTDSQTVVNETCLLVGNPEIIYNTRGTGYFSIRAEAECGSQNTGTKAYRTTLRMGVESTPFGAGEKPFSTNNCVQFKAINYQDPQGTTDNRAAYVEMTIRPCSEIRANIPRTHATAYTVSPAFGPNLSNTDLDQLDENAIRKKFSYGVSTLTFKGVAQKLIIQSDLPNARSRPQSVANDLKNISRYGLLITRSQFDRRACQTEERTSCQPEGFAPTPPN